MERIIRIEDIILKEDEVLAEVFYKEQLILRPDTKTSATDFDYCRVLSVGSDVKDIGKDDILLQVSGGDGFKVGERMFLVVRRYYIGVAVHPDNFITKNNAL